MAHSLWHLPAQELMEAVHLHLVKEYIIRLSKRRLVLKTAEQQQQLAKHILANADTIQHFCTENVSTPPTPRNLSEPGTYCSKYLLVSLGERGITLQPALSLQGSTATWLHAALPTISEIIRLQDPSAIKIEVATYATWYPDFR